MKKAILLIFVILMTVPAILAFDKTISLTLVIHENGTAHHRDMSMRYGKVDPSITSEGTTHHFKAYDKDGELVQEQDETKLFTVHAFGEEYHNNITYSTYRLPPETARIEMYEGDRKIMDEEIASLLCNNDDECNGFENLLSCKDCGDYSKDGYCDRVMDGVCDGDCTEDPDCIILEQKIDTRTSTEINKEKKVLDAQSEDKPLTEEKSDDGSLPEDQSDPSAEKKPVDEIVPHEDTIIIDKDDEPTPDVAQKEEIDNTKGSEGLFYKIIVVISILGVLLFIGLAIIHKKNGNG